MALTDNIFQITSRTIDFGDRVVAVPQIAFAASRKGHPFKVLGVLLIVTAVALLAYEFVLGAGLTALKSGGSTGIWATFVLAGLGIFGLVYQRRALVIGLADGSKIRVSGGSSAFQQRVVGCIGDAMRAEADAPYDVAVDMNAGTIDGAPPAAPMPAPYAGPNGAARNPPQRTATVPASLPPGAMPQDHMPAAPYRNGHHAPLDTLEARLNTANPTRRTGPPASAPIEVQQSGEQPSWPNTGAPVTGQRPVREPSNPIRDLDALVLFVRQSDIQHKAALLDLLAVVEDYLKGGGTIREDAVAHWQSFAGYVNQYLAGVDGLVPLTDRAGRPFAVH